MRSNRVVDRPWEEIEMNRRHHVPVMLAALLVAGAFGSGQALADGVERVIRMHEGFSRDRAAASAGPGAERRTAASDVVRIVRPLPQGTALSKGSAPSATETAPAAASPAAIRMEGTKATAALAADHWIYDADAVLYDDRDGDGYFHYLSLRIDADSYFNSAYVYAVVYLSADGETWEELLATDDFMVNGSSADDEYFVDADLAAGYPPALYDVLIELYDADLGVYADEFGPLQSSSLAVLPLEDSTYDQPIVVVTQHGGGGATSPAILLGLLGLYGATRRRSPGSGAPE
jgi:hypothetical protein